MTVGQGGEAGDFLYSIPTFRSLRATRLFALERPWTRPGFAVRSKTLSRLLVAQGYTFSPHNGEPLDMDLSTYRSGGHRVGENIINKVARWARVKADISKPWLEVEPDLRTSGRIVVNRCPRWQSFNTFPWKGIVEQYKRDILFIGLEAEWKAFCTQFGMVEYLRTADLYEAARAIKGSAVFIGNQSSCNALCEGLHHPNILEVCSYACDCFFSRPSTLYAVTGELHVEILGKEFHYVPETTRGAFTGYCEGSPIYAMDEMQCKLMVRAEHICRGLPIPFMSEITVSR